MTLPQPQPPPLCKATHVAPRNESPMQFCTAMSGWVGRVENEVNIPRGGRKIEKYVKKELDLQKSSLSIKTHINGMNVLLKERHFFRLESDERIGDLFYNLKTF